MPNPTYEARWHHMEWRASSGWPATIETGGLVDDLLGVSLSSAVVRVILP
jgi:hypothetical protein